MGGLIRRCLLLLTVEKREMLNVEWKISAVQISVHVRPGSRGFSELNGGDDVSEFKPAVQIGEAVVG